MPAPFRVPWHQIQQAVEAGMPIKEAAAKWNITDKSIWTRSQRHNWMTPHRVNRMVKEKAKEAGDRGMIEQMKAKLATLESLADNSLVDQGDRDAGEQGGRKRLDWDDLAKDYRGKVTEKISRAIELSIIPPPRNWKDMDLADRIMRRTLGLDDESTRPNTIVSLQLVNERLRSTAPLDDVVEGEFVTSDLLANKLQGDQETEDQGQSV